MAEKNNDWIHETLDRAVRDISNLGVFPNEMIEAKSLWSIPGRIMVGQMRQLDEPTMFIWFIGGNIPTDHIGGAAAKTAREALRHFSMKWQLDAARYADPETRKTHGLDPNLDWDQMTAKLVAKAEELYAMGEDERLWQ